MVCILLLLLSTQGAAECGLTPLEKRPVFPILSQILYAVVSCSRQIRYQSSYGGIHDHTLISQQVPFMWADILSPNSAQLVDAFSAGFQIVSLHLLLHEICVFSICSRWTGHGTARQSALECHQLGYLSGLIACARIMLHHNARRFGFVGSIKWKPHPV